MEMLLEKQTTHATNENINLFCAFKLLFAFQIVGGAVELRFGAPSASRLIYTKASGPAVRTPDDYA